MQAQIYNLQAEIEQLKADMVIIKNLLSRQYGPGFLSGVVVKESRPETRSGVWADTEVLRYLERKGIKTRELTAAQIQEHLRKNQKLLGELMDHMRKIEHTCSSISFVETWNILKELQFRR